MAIFKRQRFRLGAIHGRHRLFDLLGFWETRTMTKSLREISQALLDNWDTPEWNKLSKRAELMAELRAALVDPTTVSSSGWENEEKVTVEQAWTVLCETPDITSPEEYPFHALITMEQLESFMARAKLAIPDGWKLMPSDPGESWHGSNAAFEAYQSGYQDGRKSACANPTPAPRLAGTDETSTLGEETEKIVANLCPND